MSKIEISDIRDEFSWTLSVNIVNCSYYYIEEVIIEVINN